VIATRYLAVSEIDPGEMECDGCDEMPEVLVELDNDGKRKSLVLCHQCRLALIKYLTPAGGEPRKRKR
jgi:hypothetical protein